MSNYLPTPADIPSVGIKPSAPAPPRVDYAAASDAPLSVDAASPAPNGDRPAHSSHRRRRRIHRTASLSTSVGVAPASPSDDVQHPSAVPQQVAHPFGVDDAAPEVMPALLPTRSGRDFDRQQHQQQQYGVGLSSSSSVAPSVSVSASAVFVAPVAAHPGQSTAAERSRPQKSPKKHRRSSSSHRSASTAAPSGLETPPPSSEHAFASRSDLTVVLQEQQPNGVTSVGIDHWGGPASVSPSASPATAVPPPNVTATALPQHLGVSADNALAPPSVLPSTVLMRGGNNSNNNNNNTNSSGAATPIGHGGPGDEDVPFTPVNVMNAQSAVSAISGVVPHEAPHVVHSVLHQLTPNGGATSAVHLELPTSACLVTTVAKVPSTDTAGVTDSPVDPINAVDCLLPGVITATDPVPSVLSTTPHRILGSAGFPMPAPTAIEPPSVAPPSVVAGLNTGLNTVAGSLAGIGAVVSVGASMSSSSAGSRVQQRQAPAAPPPQGVHSPQALSPVALQQAQHFPGTAVGWHHLTSGALQFNVHLHHQVPRGHVELVRQPARALSSGGGAFGVPGPMSSRSARDDTSDAQMQRRLPRGPMNGGSPNPLNGSMSMRGPGGTAPTAAVISPRGVPNGTMPRLLHATLSRFAKARDAATAAAARPIPCSMHMHAAPVASGGGVGGGSTSANPKAPPPSCDSAQAPVLQSDGVWLRTTNGRLSSMALMSSCGSSSSQRPIRSSTVMVGSLRPHGGRLNVVQSPLASQCRPSLVGTPGRVGGEAADAIARFRAHLQHLEAATAYGGAALAVPVPPLAAAPSDASSPLTCLNAKKPPSLTCAAAVSASRDSRVTSCSALQNFNVITAAAAVAASAVDAVAKTLGPSSAPTVLMTAAAGQYDATARSVVDLAVSHLGVTSGPHVGAAAAVSHASAVVTAANGPQMAPQVPASVALSQSTLQLQQQAQQQAQQLPPTSSNHQMHLQYQQYLQVMQMPTPPVGASAAAPPAHHQSPTQSSARLPSTDAVSPLVVPDLVVVAPPPPPLHAMRGFAPAALFTPISALPVLPFLTFFATREASEVLAARRAANVSLGGTGTLERSGSGAMRDPRDTRRLSTHDTLGSSRAATTPMQRNFSFLGSAGATQPRTTPHGVIAPVVVNMGSACVYRSRTPPGLMTRGNNATADGDSLATTAPGKTFTAAAIMNDLNLTGPTLRDRCIYRYAKKQVLARGAFGETYIGERRDGPASIAVNGVLNAANAATTAAEQLVAATFASDEATTSNNAPILRTGSSMSPSLATTPNGGPVPLLQRGNSGGRFVTQQEEASSSAAATAQQLQIVPQQQLHGDAHPDRYSPARMAVMRRPIKHPSIQVPSMAHDASTALSCSVSTAPVQVGGQSASMDVDTADQTSLGPGTASSRGGASTSVVRERVAIKTLFAKKFSSSDRKFIQEEIACLSTCSHPNICGFVDCFERNSEISIVLELCDGSDLAHHITQRSQSGRPMPFQESEAMQIFAQACLAVEYLHRHNILHRDLKAANFMYAANIGLVKLIDFGFAKRYPTSVTADDKPPTGANADPNRVQQGVDQSFVGTPYCIAPEMWGGRPYAHKLDVWALGVLLFELLALQLPFAGRDLDHLAKNIVNNARSCDLPHNVSKAVDQLVRDLLAHDPANRPSLTSILHRPAMRFAVRSAYDKLKRQNALSEVQRCMFQQHVIAIYGGDEILTLPRLMIPRSGLTNIAQYVGNSAVHSDRGGVDPSMRSRSSESGSNSASPYAGMPSATSASFPRTGSGGGGGGGLGGGGIGSDGDPARARVVPPPLPKLDIQPNGAAALVIPPMPPGDGSTTDPEAPQFSSITFIMRATAVPPRALLAAEAYVEALDDQTVLSLIFADVLPLAFANHLYSGGSSAAAAASHPLAAAPLSANLTWWTAALMDFASETTSRPVGSKRPRPHPAASPSPQQHRDGDADTLRSSSHSPMPVGGTPVTAAVVNRLVGRVGTPSARWVPHAALLTDSELILIPMKRARRALAQYVLPRLALHLVRSTKIMDEVRALLKGPTTTPNPEMPHPTAPSVANSSQYHNPQHGLAVSARSSLRLQGPPPGAGALPPPQSQPAAAAATTTTANDITATETGTMHSGSSGNGSGNGGQRTAGSPVGNSNSKAVAPRRPISFLEFAASLYVFELPPEAKRDIQSSPRHIASTLVDDNYQRSFEATLWSFAIQRADTALRHPGCVRSPVGSGGFRRGGVTPTHAPSSPSGASFTSTSEGGAPSVSNPLQQATVANRRLSPQQPGVGPRSAHYAAGPRAGVGAVTNAVTTDSAAAVHALQFSLLFFALRGAMTVVPKPPRRFGGPSSITRPPKMKLLRYGHPDDFPPLPAIAPATVTPPGTATPPITFPLRRPAQAAATVAARPLAPTSPHYTLAGYTRFELIPTPPPPAPAPWFEAAVMPSHSSDSPSTSAVTAAGLRQQQTPQSLDSGVQHPQPQPTQGIEPKLPTASSVGGGASALSAISPAVATTSTASTATPAPGSGAGLAGPADSQPVCRASASDAVPVVVGAAPSNGDVRSGGVQHFPEYARPVVISPAVGGKSSSAPQSVCGAVAPTYPFSVAHDLPATIVWLALPAECASATSCLTPTAAAIAAEHALPPLSAGAPPAASPAARPFPPAVGECVGIELTPSAAAAAAVMGTRLPTAAGAASAGPAASGRGVAQGLLASNMEARLRQLCAGLRDWNGM